QEANASHDPVAHGALPSTVTRRLPEQSASARLIRAKAWPRSLLDQADFLGNGRDRIDRFLNESLKFSTAQVQRGEAILGHHALPFIAIVNTADGVDPIVIGFVGHAARRIKPAPVGADHVDTLLL